MRRTIIDAPFFRTLLPLLSKGFLRLAGWTREGAPPDLPKFVLIAAPHTSNWDFVYTLAISFSYGMRVFWMGKKAIFRFPCKHLALWLGGISVDRGKAGNIAAKAVQSFEENEELVVLIPPEGTRKKAKAWKKGFYYIAERAQVPIVMGYLDFKRKCGGFGPAITTTGDADADLQKIRAFYSDVTGKHPELMSPITFTPGSSSGESA
jgi:1-acyl-sn-glycerol-3-phosphate acyltransferase